MNPKKSIASLLVVWVCTALSASTGELEGALGDWLDNTAIPQLTDLLERHPRFKGEAVRVTAMRDGQPREVSDQLTDQLRQVITHGLLSGASVRIPLSGGHCPVTRISVVLGIEVSDQGQGRNGVTLALLDTDEDIWINGTIVKWSGRLMNSQQHALLRPMPMQQGFLFSQTRDIADELVDQWLCQQAGDVPVFLEVDDTVGSDLRQAFREIATSEIFVTQHRRHAQSIARLSLGNDGKVRLTVAAQDGSGAVVAGEIAIRESWHSEAVPSVLLSSITRNEKKVRCRGAHCVDISVELLQSAWVMPFSTSDGKVTPMKCNLPAKREPGIIRYGLRVPESADWYRPSLGFYLLAVDDEATAKKLQRRLGRSTRECSSIAEPADEWIAALHEIIQRPGADVTWRSMHFQRDANGISTM